MFVEYHGSHGFCAVPDVVLPLVSVQEDAQGSQKQRR